MDPGLIIIGFAGMAAAALGGGLMSIFSERQRQQADSRLSSMLSAESQPPSRSWLRTATWREQAEASLQILGRAAAGIRHFVALYDQADIAISLPRFMALVVVLALAGGILLPVYLADPRFIPIGGLGCGALPVMWMLWRRNRRLRQFSVQLPEVLDLIARAIRSGHSLNSAMRAVTDEMLPPISDEFRRVCDAVALGMPLETALEAMLLRIPSEDLRFFVTAVQIQKQSGGNLGEVLDKTGACVRDRFRIEGQIQALTGEGRISGLVLMVLPVGIFITMLAVNPNYVDLLFSDPIGCRLLQVSVGLQILGALVIQKIVKIDI
jgi:tight adherence protein B